VAFPLFSGRDWPGWTLGYEGLFSTQSGGDQSSSFTVGGFQAQTSTSAVKAAILTPVIVKGKKGVT